MKKAILKGVTILLYISLLLYMFDFNFWILVNFKELLLTILGTIILSIPYLSKENIKGNLIDVLSQNAIITGYIESFILLFFKISAETTNYDNLLKEISLCCRPIIYGFIIYVLLRNENNHKESKDVTLENNKSEKTLTVEQIYERAKELNLTKRESELAKLIINGLSNREIAEELFIAETTVKKHISNIFEKLNISSREQIKEIIYKN